MLKTQDLMGLSREELMDKVASLKKSLFEMRTQNAIARVEKPSRIRQMRRDIARILTVLGEKQREK